MKKISYIDDWETWKDGFRFSHPIKVRFSETDMFGHVNNTFPFVYFEEARIEYFKYLGFMQEWLSPDFDSMPVVADLQCDYLAQMYYGDDIEIYVKSHNVGNTSVDIHYMAVNQKGNVCLTGRGTLVQMSRQTGKGTPWTEEMRMKMRLSERASAQSE